MMSRSPPLKGAAIECECVASGEYACVWLFGDVLVEWKAVCRRKDQNSQRAAARLRRYFDRFAAMGMKGFTDETFKTLGRFKAAGGKEHLILEFKAYQFRIYGVERPHQGRRSFLGLACDPAKKDPKADKRIIQRAANAADAI